MATRLTVVKTDTEAPAEESVEKEKEAVRDAAMNMRATEVMPLVTPVISSDAEHLDPELLELFIEEAREEIATIKRHLPRWAESPDDMETLITVRRSFHTLKGSGRMVGAERIGEYCWAPQPSLL